jgi:hypothetical protein
MYKMKPVYIHGENAYHIVAEKPISYFAKTVEDRPNMEHVQMYMNWLRCDHVLNNQSNFMFCETIPIVDFEIVE